MNKRTKFRENYSSQLKRKYQQMNQNYDFIVFHTFTMLFSLDHILSLQLSSSPRRQMCHNSVPNIAQPGDRYLLDYFVVVAQVRPCFFSTLKYFPFHSPSSSNTLNAGLLRSFHLIMTTIPYFDFLSLSRPSTSTLLDGPGKHGMVLKPQLLRLWPECTLPSAPASEMQVLASHRACWRAQTLLPHSNSASKSRCDLWRAGSQHTAFGLPQPREHRWMSDRQAHVPWLGHLIHMARAASRLKCAPLTL